MHGIRLFGEQSWEIHSDMVSAAVTRSGGHLGPVEFDLGRGRRFRPFHVAPWAGTREAAGLPPVLRVLRGDFFCMPFGGNATAWRGERHPVHGETANGDWRFEGCLARGPWASLCASIETTVRPARVEKEIRLRAGHRAVYCRHTVSGASGPMCLGHHAMLAFGGTPARISCSPFAHGQVFPGEFERPAEGGYSSLRPGATFRSLKRVPALDGSFADLSVYPAREGFEDLAMVSARPGTDFAWTAAVFPDEGCAWYCLKDPRVLASTVLWHSNGGRHYPPWNGRHRRVLGLEEITGYFHAGLAESARPNPLSRLGIPTALRLSPAAPLRVHVVMGVAPVPKGFGEVKSIRPVPGGIELVSVGGKPAQEPVDTGFLHGFEEG